MSADTPRTDAAIYEEDTGYNGMVKVVSPDFARQLERELSAADSRIEHERALYWEMVNQAADLEEKLTAAAVREKALLTAAGTLLRNLPSVECNSFHHEKKDRHTGFDCPCVKRWNLAIEALAAIRDDAAKPSSTSP